MGARRTGVPTGLTARTVFIDVITVDMVQVTVVDIVDMVTVLHGFVAAVRAVHVRVIFMDDMGAHKCSLVIDEYAIFRIC